MCSLSLAVWSPSFSLFLANPTVYGWLGFDFSAVDRSLFHEKISAGRRMRRKISLAVLDLRNVAVGVQRWMTVAAQAEWSAPLSRMAVLVTIPRRDLMEYSLGFNLHLRQFLGLNLKYHGLPCGSALQNIARAFLEILT